MRELPDDEEEEDYHGDDEIDDWDCYIGFIICLIKIQKTPQPNMGIPDC